MGLSFLNRFYKNKREGIYYDYRLLFSFKYNVILYSSLNLNKLDSSIVVRHLQLFFQSQIKYFSTSFARTTHNGQTWEIYRTKTCINLISTFNFSAAFLKILLKYY